ncbi:MAG: hypothetical protein ABIU54_02195 [Candidatus Eisenbacteria bacterium]
MSGFSVSSRSLGAVVACSALALLVAVADAKVHVRGNLTNDTGHVVGRVHISDKGVVVTRTSSPDSMFDVTEPDSASGIVVDEGGTGMVRLFSDARVHAGEKIQGDVVAVFGSVDVEGEVKGHAVAVFGSVHLGPQARISEDAVAVGGQLEASEGSRVGGESVSVGFLPLLSLGLPAVPVVLFTVALGWLVSLFFGWVLGALFPTRMARTAITASRRTGLSLALGLLWGLFTPVILVLLAITVVGLPLVFLVPLLGYAGYLTATYLLGCKLTRSHPGQRERALTASAAGHLFVAMFFIVAALLWGSPGGMRSIGVFFLFSGLTLMLALSTLGTGAVLLSRLGLRPTDHMGPTEPDVPQASATPPAAGPMPAV